MPNNTISFTELTSESSDREGRAFFESLRPTVQEQLRQAISRRENPINALNRFLRRINEDNDKEPTAGVDLGEIVAALHQKEDSPEARAEQAKTKRERAELGEILSDNGVAYTEDQLIKLEGFLTIARLERGRQSGPLN